MFFTPILLYPIFYLLVLIYDSFYYNIYDLNSWIIPLFEIVFGILAFIILLLGPSLLSFGLFLMIKYRDRDQPFFPIKKIYSDIKKWFKKHNTFFSKKIKWKNVVLGVLILLIVIMAFVTFKIRRVNKRNEYWEQWEANNIQEQTIEQFKIDLLRNIPENYEVINDDSIPLVYEDADCDFIYDIYPKEYSEIEEKYLEYASVYFFKEINTVSLPAQIGEVSYDQTLKKWVFIDQNEKVELEVREYDGYNVSVATLGGSHVMRDNYIVSSKNTDDVVVLSIPTWSRVRCDFVSEDVERQECEDFLSSMGVDIDTDDSVPEEVYEEYYNELLEILENN